MFATHHTHGPQKGVHPFGERLLLDRLTLVLQFLDPPCSNPCAAWVAIAVRAPPLNCSNRDLVVLPWSSCTLDQLPTYRQVNCKTLLRSSLDRLKEKRNALAAQTIASLHAKGRRIWYFRSACAKDTTELGAFPLKIISRDEKVSYNMGMFNSPSSTSTFSSGSITEIVPLRIVDKKQPNHLKSFHKAWLCSLPASIKAYSGTTYKGHFNKGK